MNLDVKGRAIRTLSPRGYSIPRGLEKCPRPSQLRSPDSSKIQSLRHKKLAQRTTLSYLLIPTPMFLGISKYILHTEHISTYIYTYIYILYTYQYRTLCSLSFCSLILSILVLCTDHQHGDEKNKEQHPCHQNMLCRVSINASIGSYGSGPILQSSQ